MILEYDIIVIGGGHAGCEAASAAARLGSRTLLLTMDMTKMASMSCNPAVGGVAKGQIVREIDALGGQMGRITDLTTIQFRMLNRSKGAAMWSPARPVRQIALLGPMAAHARKHREPLHLAGCGDGAPLRHRRGQTPHKGSKDPNGHRVRLPRRRADFGNLSRRMMHCGTSHAEGGRAGDAASHGITESLRAIGFETDA